MRRAPLAALLALATVSCGQPLMKLPEGPAAPMPAADAHDAFVSAAAACTRVSSLKAVVAVSGTINGSRVRARLLLGAAAPASARIEAVAVGQPLFVVVTRDDRATLLLQRDRRAIENGDAAQVLEALTAVPLAPADLLKTLTGCADLSSTSVGQQMGANWRRLVDGPRALYLQRNDRSASWRLVAVVHRERPELEWRGEYQDFVDGLPRSVHLGASDRARFDLRLVLSEVELNTPLGPEVFQVNVPRGYEPMTVGELKQSGLFGAGGER